MLVHVKIYYFSVFGKGSFALDLDADATVLDALSALNDKFGEAFEREVGRELMGAFESYFNVFLNGRHLDLPSQSAQGLKGGDKLIILRPVSGG